MKKIIPIIIDKIWGYEKWLHSPFLEKQNQIATGGVIKKGPLVKIIYVKNPLSIQVHPDDKLAWKLEKE